MFAPGVDLWWQINHCIDSTINVSNSCLWPEVRSESVKSMLERSDWGSGCSMVSTINSSDSGVMLPTLVFCDDFWADVYYFNQSSVIT